MDKGDNKSSASNGTSISQTYNIVQHKIGSEKNMHHPIGEVSIHTYSFTQFCLQKFVKKKL